MQDLVEVGQWDEIWEGGWIAMRVDTLPEGIVEEQEEQKEEDEDEEEEEEVRGVVCETPDHYQVIPQVCKQPIKHCLAVPEPWKCRVICEKPCMPKCCPIKKCCD
ncbi:hypothetical protein TcWFU_002163 [Taenia crassiceps]|uniref:Uncharacterized protein n=1 Tax=Taenia crassiceps TaxID=6207 RepID=A0ABR4Q7N5_9CEST